MSVIGKNIKKIRKIKGWNQHQFAENVGLKRSSISAYEEGRAKPKIETISMIANKFGISIDQFITHELTIDEILHVNTEKYAIDQPEKYLHEKTNIPFVENEAIYDFINKKGDRMYLKGLPVVTFPFKTPGFNVAVKISEKFGIEDKQFKQGDVLLCEIVSKNKLERNKTYLICEKKRIVISDLRFLQKDGYLDETIYYKPDELITGNIELILQINGVISLNMLHKDNLEKRINKLEGIIEKMNKYLGTGE